MEPLAQESSGKLEFAEVGLLKTGRKAVRGPRIYILSIDPQPSPGCLKGDGPSAAERVRNDEGITTEVLDGGVQERADDCVRASCPPAKKRDDGGEYLAIALLSFNATI